VAVRVAVAVAVAVRVAVAVAVEVAVAVRVAVTVAVAVNVAVAVEVDVAVAVGEGVANDPFADPVSWTLPVDLPCVASLLIAMLPAKLPLMSGANSTITVACACGAISVVPCPDVILKNGLPVGAATVTESARPPLSLIVKVWLPV
jgi:hypothetical protein